MTRNVALLRGVNLGAHKKVPMADLRGLLSDLGYTDVQTYVQSGNAVFTASGKPAELARDIEKALDDRLGLTVPVLVRTAEQMRAVLAGDPFGDLVTKPAQYYAVFLADQPSKKRLAEIDPEAYEESFAAGDRVIYVWYPDGMGKARLTHAFLERKLGTVATARNWNTVTKLAEMAAGG